MPAKELSRYIEPHEIAICRNAAEAKIPAIQICRVWRPDEDVIVIWNSEVQTKIKSDGKSKRKGGRKESENKKPRKWKGWTYLGYVKIGANFSRFIKK